MSPRERAKQFQPFDALKGLQAALRIKEYEHDRVTRGDLSEDAIAEISRVLLALQLGDRVKAVYYENGAEQVVTGVAQVDLTRQRLRVANVVIALEDLLSLIKIA